MWGWMGAGGLTSSIRSAENNSLGFNILLYDALGTRTATFRSRPGKPKKGAKQKVQEFRPFFSEFWCFFLGKTSTIHIELLFRNAPAKSS